MIAAPTHGLPRVATGCQHVAAERMRTSVQPGKKRFPDLKGKASRRQVPRN